MGCIYKTESIRWRKWCKVWKKNEIWEYVYSYMTFFGNLKKWPLVQFSFFFFFRSFYYCYLVYFPIMVAGNFVFDLCVAASTRTIFHQSAACICMILLETILIFLPKKRHSTYGHFSKFRRAQYICIYIFSTIKRAIITMFDILWENQG